MKSLVIGLFAVVTFQAHAASITAAREGTKVRLIEPTKHVGGLSTSGINTAESEHLLKWTIGGFADEFYRRMGRHDEETKAQQRYPHQDKQLNTIYFFESSVAEKVYLAMLKEVGVEIRHGASVGTVSKDGATITGQAAAMAVIEGIPVQKVNITALQDKLRAQHQVINFLPGQPEKGEHLNGPPQFGG